MSNPSLAIAANVYRRQFGEWPTWVRFDPFHFGHWASEADAEFLVALGTALDIEVTKKERSPRLTVGGAQGEVTYDDGVTEADWDASEFEAWVKSAT